MNYIIFGGSGFIGTHLIKLLKSEYLREGDKIYDLDIVMPGEEGVVPGVVEKIDGVEYIRFDVRDPIIFGSKPEDGFTPTKNDIIFNLAAVHRTPGHPDYAYFGTNIKDAENITAFAEKYGIKKILFTSSIAPYGAAEELKEETTLPTPNTPYGISKLVSEKIHMIWQAKDTSHELTIVRPGIVYGKGEHGNMTRLYKGQKGHYFVYTGRKDTIKACIYVKELCRFFAYRMIENNFPGVDIYNCTFEPAYNIQQICETMQKATGMKRHIPLIPGGLLMTVATIVGPLGGKKLGIHPARVKKLMISTNICGKKLTQSGYKFHYTLEESFRDWFEDCGKEGLF
ncbi:MAG TPA: NAD(P)-dependent oxidoreductase [Candidatus Blautia faecipullorum]|nr:NAD(P)-dependent oxidoreductase [Candidatus Blautia faecipullorum]